MNTSCAGFLLTRHWRDSSQGTEIVLWLAIDNGPQRLVLPAQESVAFIPCDDQPQVEALLRDERQVRLQPLELKDFRRLPVFASICRQHRQLQRLEKLLADKAISQDEMNMINDLVGEQH